MAHFHYTVFGTVVFLMFAGFYFWWPKWTGKMLDERIGMIHFWLLFIGFQVTFLIQHWLGAAGMPRRYGDYLPEDNFIVMEPDLDVRVDLVGLSTLAFLYNVWRTAKRGERVTVDDPWGWGRSLEWATSCPPPRHNFDSIPRIRSESPAFDLHHPEIALGEGDVHNESVLAECLRCARSDAPRGHRRRHRRGQGRGADMRVSGRLFAVLAVFFALLGVIYWCLAEEPAGTAALVFTGALASWSPSTCSSPLAASSRCRRTTTRATLPRAPASRASTARTAGGRCRSAWGPRPSALGLVFIMWWMIILGVVVTMVGVTGMLFEYYQGSSPASNSLDAPLIGNDSQNI